MKAIVCGSRNYTNYDNVLFELTRLVKENGLDHVVNGGATGADELASRACKELGIKCTVYRAKWKELGRSAGPIRNMEMLTAERPDVVVSFSDDYAKSKGTMHMMRIACEAGVHVVSCGNVASLCQAWLR